MKTNSACIGRTGPFFLAMILLLLAFSAVEGAIYRWEDDEGNVSFSDDLNKIPKQYRDQAEKMASFDNGKEVPSRSSRPPILFEQKTDAQGNGKDWWRKLVRKWEDKKRDAEDRIDELELELRQLKFHKMSAERRAREELRLTKLAQAARLRRDVAIRMLTEGLPDEARKAGAPQEWLSDKP